MELSRSASDGTPRAPGTLVLACADETAIDRRWKPTLRDHALVLRSHGGRRTDAALASLVQAGRIVRVLVLEHTGCQARDDDARAPLASTAAIAAWCRLAPAVDALSRARARAEIGADAFQARLDALVRLANLEACAEVHHALRRGALDVRAAVYDGATASVALFDGRTFAPVGPEQLARLIAGRRGEPSAAELLDLEPRLRSRPGTHAPPSAECAL